MILQDKIKSQLKNALKDSDNINLINERNDGYHFSLQIVSKDFEGKSPIERSRMIYAALDNLMKSGEIHALELKLSTPKING